MIPVIDRLLELWAAWRATPYHGKSLGMSPFSTVYKMMTEDAATERKAKYRRRPPRLKVGDETVPRHTDPVHAKATRSTVDAALPDNRAAELMDRAVAALRPVHRDAVEMFYCKRLDMKAAAYEQRCSKSTFQARINHAHFYIEAWIKGRYGDKAAKNLLTD